MRNASASTGWMAFLSITHTVWVYRAHVYHCKHRKIARDYRKHRSLHTSPQSHSDRRCWQSARACRFQHRSEQIHLECNGKCTWASHSNPDCTSPSCRLRAATTHGHTHCWLLRSQTWSGFAAIELVERKPVAVLGHFFCGVSRLSGRGKVCVFAGENRKPCRMLHFTIGQFC